MARRTRRRRKPQPSAQAAPPRRDGSRAPVKILLTAGAIAGAIGSLLGLPPAVRALFHHPYPIVHLRMLSARTMTFGESRVAVGGRPQYYSKSDRALHGALIRYEIATEHYEKGAQLPMQWTVTDVDRNQVRHLAVVPLTVKGQKECTCHRWVPALNKGDHYEARLAIYSPGGFGEDNPKIDRAIPFTAR